MYFIAYLQNVVENGRTTDRVCRMTFNDSRLSQQDRADEAAGFYMFRLWRGDAGLDPGRALKKRIGHTLQSNKLFGEIIGGQD